MAQDRYVAIIGGGIGGLSAAYFLHGRPSADGKSVYRCEVFEKSDRLGGNGLSAYFEEPFRKPFADLGVNDFNLTSYTIMHRVLDELKAQGFEVPYAPLTDTDCYFTLRGEAGEAISFTSQDLKDPKTELTRDIAADQKKFDALASRVPTDPKYAAMSVGEFLSSEGFSDAFRNAYMLPRINGMYFMGETVPEDMPIRGVMSYYILQEGIGMPGTPERRYFERGCSQWFAQLRAVLTKRGVVFHLNDSPTVIAREGQRPHVQSRGSSRTEWDQVVLGVPADAVPAVVAQGLPALMPTLLAQFRYINSIAVAHEYEAVMPPRREDWRTYNIRIFPKDARLLRPYTISYVETMHQGAQTAAPPTWFVSENPPVPIPDHYVRERIVPETRQREKSVAYFRHNTVTVDSRSAQCLLPAMQGQNGLWYTGGWTNGAGLHEEILAMSQEITARMRGFWQLDEPLHACSDKHPHHVPRYMADALGLETNAPALSEEFWSYAEE